MPQLFTGNKVKQHFSVTQIQRTIYPLIARIAKNTHILYTRI